MKICPVEAMLMHPDRQTDNDSATIRQSELSVVVVVVKNIFSSYF